MKSYYVLTALFALGVSVCLPVRAQNVVINELMYNPPSADPAEEWIELHNRETNAINLTGWRLSDGVAYTFPNVTIPAGGYLVVAANTNAFSALYPGLAVVGGWLDALSNNGEGVELEDAGGQRINRVRYATEGSWGVRRRLPDPNTGTPGWEWTCDHDGIGKSAELINGALSNDSGQNWAPSGPVGGTPGAVNSTAAANLAPMILDVAHFPIVPSSTSPVTVSARIVDEQTVGLTVSLFHRTLSNPFNQVQMFDDGAHNDGAANDGVYAAVLPATNDQTIVEFYIQASDGVNTRTQPAPAVNQLGQLVQTVNMLYQVDNTVYVGTQPFYRVILTVAERAEFQTINRQSDAEMNCTFVTVDGIETQVRHNCGIRIRGAGSRGRTPPNNRLNIPNEDPWKGVDAINLNCQYSHAQVVGSAVAQKAGLPVADARVVQVRINGVNPANAGLPQFGSYVAVEPINADWAENHFPLDPDGNVYRASSGSHSADLSYRSDAAGLMSAGYSKTSNTSENDWSDLINLTFVLNNTPPATYTAAVEQVANVDNWMKFFAVHTLMEYTETSLGSGEGDDYAMYRGINDPRFLLIAHDLDTIFGQGDTQGNVNENIFIAADTDQPAVARFLTWPDFAPRYYAELDRLLNTTFSPPELFPIFDRLLKGFVPDTTIATMKTFATNRNNYVRSQIPLNLTVATNNLQFLNGYSTATNSTVTLTGLGNVIRTRSIRVNGSLAGWGPVGGRWTNTVNLLPGINRVLVQAFDASGVEFQRTFVDIRYEDGTIGVIPSTISANTTLTAAGGPYEVTTMITVAAGATLTIEPGTTFYVEPGSGFAVNGRLLAQGTETQRIRFTRIPGSSGIWNGIRFNNSTNDNRLTYADIDFAASADAIVLVNSTLLIDNVTWTGTTRTIIDLSNSSLICRNSVFPTIVNNETIHGMGMPANGYVIIESNRFGGTTGYSDIIDFTGGKRPGPILQVLNNIFDGGSDDALDLDGTDAHIEGNLFQHIHQDDPLRDSASHAIATDFDAEITVVRNVFYDNDHGVLLKNGAFLTAENNTFINCTVAAISFDETNRNVNPGQGALIDGCIFWNNGAPQTLFRNLYFNHPTETNTQLTVVRSLTQGTNYPGIGNINADPLFVNYDSDFRLRAGSPAIGTGPNGLDMGALVPGGASISGEPPNVTPRTSVVLTVDGPGITHYRYRVNGGAFGAEEVITEPIALSGLANGAYTVYVIGKNSAGVWQDPTNATASRQWTVNTGASGLRINEILARNDTAVPVGGEFPDMIELYNAGTTSVNLSGMGITDDANEPFKFVFPTGTSLAGGQYLLLLADNETGPGIHLGFALSQDGDDVLLYLATGALADRVAFGPQLPDLSIGRHTDGHWGLTRPTFGSANIAHPASDARALKINEWLASPGGLLRDDFLELYNPLPVPANFGGAYLTDAPQHAPTRHLVAPLSFVAANGFVALTADGKTNQGPDHLNFKLSGDQGEIGLFAPDLTLIDCIVYGPQVSGIAEGRVPSGSSIFGRIDPPTPGGPNPGGVAEPTNVVINVISLASDWRYQATGADLGTAWRATSYDDSAWPVGAALLAREDCGCLPAPGIQTTLPLSGTNTQPIVTYYFRQRVVLSTNLAEFRLTASTVIDDGAVIYINGQEAHRIRMPSGTIGYNTNAQSPSVNNAILENWLLPTNHLVEGENVIAVEVHQLHQAQPSTDVAFGLSLEARRTFTNMVDAIALNEVLANNVTVTLAGQTNITDWVELVNTSSSATDLSDMSLTDDASSPRRWVFPAGVTIPAGGYLLVRFDSLLPPSTNNTGVLNTGFGLSAGGDDLYLFDKLSRGGGLLNSIVFGIQAADYSVGRFPNPNGGWQLNLPTPGGPNILAPLGTPNTLKINEWLARPSGNDEDYFEFYNPNNLPVHLGGLSLSDTATPGQYLIPNLSFIGTGADGFVRFVADSNPGAGADHVNFRLSADGETIGLYAPNGIQIDAVSFDSQDAGVSEGRFPDGSANLARFPGTGTPGASNVRPINDIVISEVLTHTDLPLEDAIELQNVGPGAVDISGWWLSDQKNDPKKFRIPPGTVIQAGGFVVFYEYQFNAVPGIYPSFSLSSLRGDEVFLFTANAAGDLTGFRTGEDFGPAANGVSFGRYQTSVGFDLTAMSQRTFGADVPSSVEQFRTGTGLSNAYPKVGPIVINEIMYHPPNIGTNDNFQDEFIELHNTAGTNVVLFDPAFPTNRWRLRDAVDFDFPQGAFVSGGGYVLVVSFSPTNTAALNAFRSRYGLATSVPIFGPFNGRLDNGGENVELYRPDSPEPVGTADAGVVAYIEVDRIKYSDGNPWPSLADGYTNGVGASLQRRVRLNYGNDPVNWLAGAPTPGAATGSALVAPPAITSQPANQTIAAGGSATFTVAATGAAPLTYQWRFNGVNINGATTPSLTINNAQLPQAGGYSVRIVNSAGAAVSVTAILTVQAPPMITQQPQSRSVAAGGMAIFSVTAQGTPPLAYQWLHNGTPVSGATSGALVVTNVQPALEGEYTVRVSNNFGAITSLVANLSISAVPVIIAQPQPTNVFVGATVTFTVGVSGSPPLVYQWRFNNANIPGATSPSLTLTDLQISGTGNYSVFVTNDVGAALSSPALLTVTVPPVVTVVATDGNASEPGANPGTFTVRRTGSSGRALTVEFAVNGSAVPGSDYNALTSPVVIPAGSLSEILTVTPLNDSSREGNETVVLTVNASSEYVLGSQSAATVTIFDDDNLAPSVTITNPIAGSMYNAGVDVAVSATASDADGTVAKVEFFYNATNKIGEVLAAPYSLTWSNVPSGAHVLTAVATDDLGSTAESAPVSIDVNRAPIASITAPANGASFFAPAQINITATASDPDGSVTNVQFYAGTNLIGSDATPPYTALFGGVQAGTYVLTARAIDNQGVAGTSSPVIVTVIAAPPRFDDTFANRGVIQGFTNFVTGNNSTYTKESGEPRHDNKTGGHSAWIQWVAPGSGTCTIDTFTSDFDTVLAVYRGTAVSSLTFVASNDDDVDILQSRLSFAATAGTAYVIAVDGYGSTDFGNIRFHLNLPNLSPVISQQPTNQTVNQGGSATFAIIAAGAAPLRYQWFFGGAGILNATNTSLVLSNVRATNEGAYYCIVSNANGFATSASATLTVRVPPSIVTQPTNQTVNPGATATLGVSVAGTAPFSYQWRFNGTNLAGRTSPTLVLNNVQHTNAGNYSISVANSVGSAVSQAAELIVRPQLVSVRRLPSAGDVELTLRGTPGRNYVVETTTNLTAWFAVTNLTISTVPQQQVERNTSVIPRRHYRVRLTP
jgi:hypothetical protein